MQSFVSMQHCLLSLAFQSTHQILLWHFQGILSLHSTFNILSFHNLPISLFKSWYFFHFLPFFFPYFYIIWYSNIDDYTLSFFHVNCLVFLPLSRCPTEYWYPTTLSLLHFPLSLLGSVHTIFTCVLAHFSYKGRNGLSLRHCHVVSYILSEEISHIHLLNVEHFYLFFHIICTRGFHWSYQCGALFSLSWWSVPVQHIITLLFRSSNHFWITIAKFYPYQLYLAFPWQTVHAFSFHASFV